MSGQFAFFHFVSQICTLSGSVNVPFGVDQCTKFKLNEEKKQDKKVSSQY